MTHRIYYHPSIQINKPTDFSIKSQHYKTKADYCQQTVTAEYPAYMEVEGAIRLGSEEAGAGAGNVSTWQWKVVLPTPWRLDEGYIQVER